MVNRVTSMLSDIVLLCYADVPSMVSELTYTIETLPSCRHFLAFVVAVLEC